MPLRASLRAAHSALRQRELPGALREIDRCWRSLPSATAAIASIYGRLLSLEGEDPDAALTVLNRIEAPDPECAALRVHALLQLRRGEDARRELQRALGDYCVDPAGLLARVATDIVQHSGTAAAGWVGINSKLEFVGELASGSSPDNLRIRVGEEPEYSAPKGAQASGSPLFRFRPAHWTPGAALRLHSGGVRLLGTDRLPSRFGVDGRSTSAGRRISGWARIGWQPELVPALRFEDEAGHQHLSGAKRHRLPDGHWAYNIDLRPARLQGDRIAISVQVPDGRWQPLPDSPLLLRPALRSRRRVALGRMGVAWGRPAIACDVIIPVYRGRRETLACIDSVIATVASDVQIIVIDDATDDTELAGALDTLAGAGRITLRRNASNQGFVRSVNSALALHPTNDAVVLNSDTLVHGNWLERLRAAAYSAPRIGTVTPWSNSGSIASYPSVAGSILSGEEAGQLDSLAGSVHAGVRPEIPVGVGFCLYVRRDCLRDVGELDAEVFGRGYGEEVDFCLRARKRGWMHRLAADVYVYHSGGLSFGSERAALLDRSQRLLELRHPGFSRSIADFGKRDPLRALRRGLDRRRLAEFSGRFVLLVTLAMSGGVKRFVNERSRAIREQGQFPLLLRPCVAGDARSCELWTDALDVPNLRFDIPNELSELRSLLAELELAGVEIQHFLHLDAKVIEMVRALKRPYDVYVHDYAWICPRVTLIDGSGRYCGEPVVSVCASCVKRNGSNLRERISVPALRERSDVWLRGAHRVIAPSQDTADRLKRHFRGLAVDVRAHAELAPQVAPEIRSVAGAVLRIALIGGIGIHKGYRILLDCARDAHSRRLPLEFVVIGHTHDDAPLLRTGKVFVTGPYSEGEAPHLLRREQPNLVFLPSVWPETWSYALDEAFAAGIPVVAFDLGAIAERLRAANSGVLLPLALSARQINDRLLQIFVHSSSTPLRDDAIMATLGDVPMTKKADAQAAPPDGFAASVQILPLPPGLYLFSVKSERPARRSDGQLQLPALHVGLGPGVAFDQVEFVAGPSTNGAWLFAPEDLLVTKVRGTGATMVLTSVRDASGAVLSIKVERLDTRTDVLATAAVAAAPAQATDAAARHAPAKPSSVNLGSSEGDAALSTVISTHIRSRGDMTFSDEPWAGRVAPGLWVEAFSIRPLEQFTASDIEYKGLTGSGYETAWLSDDEVCGTKGLSVPLIGFAIRLKPSALTASFDCEYSGYFRSGVTVGPLQNGAPCRSTVANDPLEGIQVRIRRKPAAAGALAKLAAGPLASLGRRRATTNGGPPGGLREPKSAPAHASGKSAKGKVHLHSTGNGRAKPDRRAAAGRSSRR